MIWPPAESGIQRSHYYVDDDVDDEENNFQTRESLRRFAFRSLFIIAFNAIAGDSRPVEYFLNEKAFPMSEARSMPITETTGINEASEILFRDDPRRQAIAGRDGYVFFAHIVDQRSSQESRFLEEGCRQGKSRQDQMRQGVKKAVSSP